jgi:hypothetical protein
MSGSSSLNTPHQQEVNQRKERHPQALNLYTKFLWIGDDNALIMASTITTCARGVNGVIYLSI